MMRGGDAIHRTRPDWAPRTCGRYRGDRAGRGYSAGNPFLVEEHFKFCAAGVAGKILAVALNRPTPLILLTMAILYLWVYVRCDSASAETAASGDTQVL